ncbi:MAG TPA: hybrid sensor histidine kinase/response regulator, partial [Anaeromyxobacteraceae bacterium]|nr:hybrid sensor histidine kinase/response regulator [Anaeromyxobacteraceae bacterium]
GAEPLAVLAPVGRDAELAAGVLAEAGHACVLCASAADLAAALDRGVGAVLLTEEALTGEVASVLAAHVAGQPAWSDLPVVLFTGPGGGGLDAPEVAGRLAALGNVTRVERPLRRSTLLSVAAAALRARARQRAARDVLVRLEESVRQRDEFLAMLGHELRNPLAAIAMAGELLAREGVASRPAGIVRRQARQLARLVDDLLDVSRVTSGRIVLERSPTDLSALVARAVEDLAPTARATHDVEVTFAGGPAELIVCCDGARVEQIVANLVGNGVKYTLPGGHVRVALAREAGQAVLVVQDDGIGIARENLEAIFEPFVQVASAFDRSRTGLGLGLALVQGLVRLHGGEVAAESEGPGRGSRFLVRLPLSDGAAVAVEARPAAVTPRSILVVEDNPDLREAFREMLAVAGHSVRVADDGPAGVQAALSEPPEVAFIDIGLPGFDGYEVARRVRRRLGGRVRLVALTGYGRPEDRARSRDAGFDAHLTKPVTPSSLAQALTGTVH